MKKNISSRLDEIEEWMNEQLPIDWITRELKCSRDTFRKYFPDYKGNQGGRPDRVAAIRQEYEANPKTCKLCNKVMPFDKRRNAFCSMSCSSKKAAERWKRKGCAQTEELRKKLSNVQKERWKGQEYRDSQSKHRAKQPRMWSSKNERKIVKHFKDSFPDDEWKSGGSVKLTDGVYLSRDLWSDKLKVCFEYDGIWHFKDIHGQLGNKQMKDALLEEWCTSNGYRLVRVDEDDYIDVEQITELIYKMNTPIIKVGERY